MTMRPRRPAPPGRSCKKRYDAFFYFTGVETHTSRNHPGTARRVSASRLRDNARLLEEQTAGSNQVSRHLGEAGEGAEQTAPGRDAAQTTARTGDHTHSGRLGSGRLSAARPRGPSRISANTSGSVRLMGTTYDDKTA